MLFYFKKIFGTVISFFYIFVNLNFYNSIFHEYVNDKIFHITLWLGIVETFFWIMLLYSVFYLKDKSSNTNSKSQEEAEKKVVKDIRDLLICFAIFLVSLICINISRVILQSSPYMNDVVSSVSTYVLFVGGTRVLFIFSSIVFIFIAVSRKSVLLIIISVLNLGISVMIWLDFDANITAVMRIIIAILAIIHYIFLKNTVRYTFKENDNGKIEMESNQKLKLNKQEDKK
ncbi:hypothetical protein [Leptotrichia sp. oral taxon 879]|uniref:hypothetical protein n=1 Tax=Leptotrichia sp. oral taxon 879 TaxID=1227267 RepID=UPI0003AD77A8|nr:hypothetical protein [Leptotrichia sp. oral taxon 879]ERK49721.1 hypothetical protein HMPREF1552_01648 [Leptotrichia sp. oral taxon 879 str. F0557]